MKLNKVSHVENFMAACDKCKNDVWLVSPYGDRYNLKSKLSQYLAIAELLGECGDEMELFCGFKDDEVYFREFFREYPEVLFG